jgi:hypothetical protein
MLSFTLLTVVQICRRWRIAGRPVRRAYAPVWLALVAIGVIIAIIAVVTLAGAPEQVVRRLFIGYGLVVAIVPVAVGVGLLRRDRGDP